MMTQTAWDTSAILSDTSLFGRVLHTLIGYSDEPSVLQVLAYALTLAVIVTFDEDGRIAPSFGGKSEPRSRGVSAKPRELPPARFEMLLN